MCIRDRTWPLSYAPFVWTLMELVLVLYDKLMIRSYEQQLQEYQNKVFDRQVQEVEHMYTTMRAWRHDYHNHLQNLKAKLRKGEVKESDVYKRQPVSCNVLQADFSFSTRLMLQRFMTNKADK